MSSSTPLQERIARTVWEVCAEPFTPTISHASANEVAISILPIIAAEVRRGKADAWDRAVRSLSYPDGSPVEVLSNPNPYRAQENHPEVTQ